MPRLALFDLDETLIDSTAAFDAWVGELIEERGLGAAATDWFGSATSWKIRPEQWFARITDHFGLDDDPADLLKHYRSRFDDLLRPYPGVLDGLEALRDAGWRIGIVTNGYADFQASKIEAVGLGAYVDVICVSDSEASWKPEPRIFQLASERAGAPLEGAWMVGDSLAADIAGGNGLGLHTAWVSHGYPLPDGAPVPTHVVQKTADVFALILG